jgi:hypothetical protein
LSLAEELELVEMQAPKAVAEEELEVIEALTQLVIRVDHAEQVILKVQ